MRMASDKVYRCFEQMFQILFEGRHQKNLRRHIDKNINIAVRMIVTPGH